MVCFVTLCQQKVWTLGCDLQIKLYIEHCNSVVTWNWGRTVTAIQSRYILHLWWWCWQISVSIVLTVLTFSCLCAKLRVPVYIRRTRRTWCHCTVHAGRASWRQSSFFWVTEHRRVKVMFRWRLHYTGRFSMITTTLYTRCWRSVEWSFTVCLVHFLNTEWE